MTLYDSSVLIDYLAGDDRTVAFIESRATETAVAPPLVLFELYQGEVYSTGAADFDRIDAALQWLSIVDETPAMARRAAELQAWLSENGTPLSARDAFIAGAAVALDETLAVADSDFDVEGIESRLAIELVC